MSEQLTVQAKWILLSISILCFLINVDFSAVNLALVKMADELHSDLSTMQWILSAYVLTWGAFVVVSGRLADIFGRRRLYLWGVIFFVIGSIVTGIATTHTLAIAGRVIQGFGGALFVPTLYTLVFTSTPASKQGLAIGILSSTVGLGLALGPTLGGFIINYSNWRYIFLINVPFCFLATYLLLKNTDKEPSRLSEDSVDIPGAVVLGLAMPCLIMGLNGINNWSNITVISLIIISFALVGIFAWHQRRCPMPLVKLSLFKNRDYNYCLLSFFFEQYLFVSMLFILGLYLQLVYQFTPFKSGVVMLAMTAVFGCFSPFGGRLVDTISPRIPVVTGLIIAAAASALLAYFSNHPSLWLMLVMLFMLGSGIGIAFSALNAVMLKTVDVDNVSTASGVFAMVALLGCTLGILATTILLKALTHTPMDQGLDISVNPVLLGDAINHLFVANIIVALFSAIFGSRITLDSAATG